MRTTTDHPNRLSRTARTTAVAVAFAALLAPVTTTSATAAAPPAAGAGAAARTGAGQHTATQQALKAVVEEGLPGVAAEAWTGKERWFGEAGYADTSTHRKRSRADHFRAASITKVFIATVLLQLQQERRLDLDDTVDAWLPGVVRGNGNDGRKIRLRQLLNHTSGLSNYTDDPGFARRTAGPGFAEHRYDTYRPEDLVALAMKSPPRDTPGAAHYSNTNYILAGMVIEKATGHSYAYEAERRIVRPLGLRETTFPGLRAAMPRPHPVGYSRLHSKEPNAPIVDATEQNMSWLGAAGEVISTTGDLNTLFHALLRGRLLAPEAMREMLTTVHSEEDGFDYGLGVESVTLSCGVRIYGKTGRTNGSLSGLAATKDAKHQLAFNINGDWPKNAATYVGVVDAEFCATRTP
ncbi:serine hydrolase domain-containing protein [Streptomyces sp. NPDC042319]|uniref:serine hydrolase domain-containing protein n=1 Tax=Streptomyces sp. NPDC042319 TaxID=3154332 RepID=UPI0033DBBFAF